jgi:hypothetical protein
MLYDDVSYFLHSFFKTNLISSSHDLIISFISIGTIPYPMLLFLMLNFGSHFAALSIINAFATSLERFTLLIKKANFLEIQAAAYDVPQVLEIPKLVKTLISSFSSPP